MLVALFLNVRLGNAAQYPVCLDALINLLADSNSEKCKPNMELRTVVKLSLNFYCMLFSLSKAMRNTMCKSIHSRFASGK